MTDIPDRIRTSVNTSTFKSLIIEQVLVSVLKLNPDNPRIHNRRQRRQIAASIRKFGFLVPVLIDGGNNIIAGHGRVMVATELGLERVPAIRIEHLSETEKRAFMIAENKLTENAEWDERKLALNFKLIAEDLNIDIDITGFEVCEVDACIEGIDPVGPEDDEALDDMPLPGQPPVTRRGDSWLLGKNRLFCGSSLESNAFVTLMDGRKAAMIFIDPPYNVRIHGHATGHGAVRHREFAMASGEMQKQEYIAFLRRVFELLIRHSVDGSIHFACIDWRHVGDMLTAGEAYTELKNICVWVKDNGGMGAFYRSAHELICVFKSGTAPHRNNIQLGQFGRYRTNVWRYAGVNSFARESEEGNLLELHPTVKPVALVKGAIEDCSSRNDIILDCFLGSGSTLIAAERAGRVCNGLEIDPLYVDTAIRRWQTLSGLKAVHAESGKTFEALEAEVEMIHD